jgi:glycosyltransferase involved in cell wall biosynthesis
MKNDILVSICAITYNQASYIRQCLDGFLMQKTDFKYEIIIHDDCSTDGTTEIVREYAEKHSDLVKPIFQTVNQYQNGNKRILATYVYPRAKGKYYAICEGDDYWIDPYKLQKQVNYLETHPECVMTCNRTKQYSEKQHRFIGDNYCYNQSQEVETKDIILGSGLFISTCSILYRCSIMGSYYPDYCLSCHVGDYPLQVFAALKGGVYYFNDAMSVYRVANSSSWVGKSKKAKITEIKLEDMQSEIDMLNGFANDFPLYKETFETRKLLYILYSVPNRMRDRFGFQCYCRRFSDIIENFSVKQKIKFIYRSTIPNLF